MTKNVLNTYYSSAFPYKPTCDIADEHMDNKDANNDDDLNETNETTTGYDNCDVCLENSLPLKTNTSSYVFIAYCIRCALVYDMQRGCIDDVPAEFLSKPYDEELHHWLEVYYSSATAKRCRECQSQLEHSSSYHLCINCQNPDNDPHWPPLGS